MSPLTHRPIRALIVLLTALALLAAGAGTMSSATAGAAPAATTLSYGKPTPITGIRSTFRSVSCVSATFCMAGDENGQLLRFDGRSWTTSTHFAESEGVIESVSCTSTTFCMAGYEPQTGTFHLLTYNGRSWTSSQGFAENYFGRSDCASSTLCFVFDQYGYIHGWTGSKWVTLKTRFDDNVVATACASTTLCFAVARTGDLFRYNGHAWTKSKHSLSGSRNDWSSLSCPSATSCMAVSRSGKTAQYSRGAWSRTTTIAGGGSFVDLTGDCASATFCAAADVRGRTATYRDGTWSADPKQLPVVHPTGEKIGPFDVSCSSVSSCVAVGYYGSYWVRTAKGWGPRAVDAPTADPVTALSCATATSCVAWDQRLSFGDYDGTTWTGFRHSVVNPDFRPTSVSCPRISFCVVVTNLRGFEKRVDGRWQRPFQDIRAAGAPGRAIRAAAVSCAGPTLCLTVSAPAPTLAVGSITAYDGKRWSAATRPDGEQAASVSCVNGARFCAAGTTTGSVVLYTGHSWSAATPLPGAGTVNSISCSSTTSCMAVSGSRTYAYDGTTWTAFTVPGNPPLLHVSCASSDACGAVGYHTATYFDGTAWSAAERIDSTGDVNVAIACPVAEKCVVATSGGEAIVGT